ncbi:hypothetical protein ACFV6E_08450 [Streptomyces sp. NPDC059785]|uniref:hypothetical protein n=1 Tax=unclassified Streptomyces TaxID=2593676 RepID=UPI00365C8899
MHGPFIASFVAADAHAERPWLAVEFVHGPDLQAHVAERGPLPLVETASPGALLAEGLGTVHERDCCCTAISSRRTSCSPRPAPS